MVPSRDSAITEIPNFVLNAPPHHLSWWNEDALRVLADRLDLLTEAIEAVPFSFDTALLHGSVIWRRGVEGIGG